MSHDFERATDEALSEILQGATEYQIQAIHEAASRECALLGLRFLADISARPPRLRLARYLADRAEIELGAREAIRDGAPS